MTEYQIRKEQVALRRVWLVSSKAARLRRIAHLNRWIDAQKEEIALRTEIIESADREIVILKGLNK